MTQIIAFLQSSVSYAVPMIILLGLLIFIHEMGHFLVAKYYKVRVEVFSLGFGPKILKFKKGDTVYAISAIPLGGYVKMFGDDPSAEIDADQREHSFIHKPVGQRIAVVLAGPLMNFFFAILLFAAVSSLGEKALAPKLGDVEMKSPAYSAGFRSGDTVMSAGAQTIQSWDDFKEAIEKSADVTIPVKVARESGQEETLQVTPQDTVNKNVLSWDRHVGEIDGLSYASRSSVIGLASADSIAGRAGIKTGDVIHSVNGEKITKWRELTAALAKLDGAKNPVAIEVERGLLDDSPEKAKKDPDASGEILKFSLQIPKGASTPDEILKGLGMEFPQLYLAGVGKGTPAEKAGLKKGDRLVSIDGKKLGSFEDVTSIIRSYSADEKDPKPLAVVVDREGQAIATTVIPQMKERMNNQAREEKRFEIGISPMILDAAPATLELQTSGLLETLKRGFTQTMKWTSLTVLSFVRLFQAEVSPKNIGGFLSIGQMAKASWAMGPAQYLHIMAIISINLFILNLLPVPVLDGGHLVFYSIEALRGAPVSMRKMEIAQQVGLFLLLGLMVLALFNDVTRIFNIFN